MISLFCGHNNFNFHRRLVHHQHLTTQASSSFGGTLRTATQFETVYNKQNSIPNSRCEKIDLFYTRNNFESKTDTLDDDARGVLILYKVERAECRIRGFPPIPYPNPDFFNFKNFLRFFI